jgi:hypothetical protein
VAKKKKPVETIDVVEVTEAETDAVVIADDVEGELDGDVAESEVTDQEGIVDDLDKVEDADKVEDSVAELAEQPTRSSGLLPLILGGVVAAAIGFVAARSNVVDNFLPPSWRMNAGEVVLQDQISSAQSQLNTLNEKVAALSSELADMPTDDNGLEAQITKLAERLNSVEKRPTTAGNGGSDAGGDFAALRANVEKQQAEIDALLADARLEKQSADDAASSTLARAAATRIVAAIESGAPFSGALSDLEATGASDIPEALRSVATDGVITLAKLQATIPDASRAALAASPVDADGGLGGFLKRQLGARSVAPREGNDPDAILSRVEGAVREGRLTDALAEVETLPEESKSAMSGWTANATTRLAVTSASQALMQRLVAN